MTQKEDIWQGKEVQEYVSAMRFFYLLLLAYAPLVAAPTALAVVAHPDDEVAFAATAYAMVHELDATFDVVIITDGQGGYKHASFAEPIYGLPLTEEAVGRAHLPAIRREEALEGGGILGIGDYTFLDQRDWRYTRDLEEPLAIWNVSAIEHCLGRLVGNYDYLFVLLPTDETHGHHKAASLLALEAVARLPEERRPITLGANFEPITYEGLPNQPLTLPSKSTPIATFDRHDYQVIVNWFIAAHKSQGSLQLLANRFDQEYFYSFALNSPSDVADAVALFDELRK